MLRQVRALEDSTTMLIYVKSFVKSRSGHCCVCTIHSIFRFQHFHSVYIYNWIFNDELQFIFANLFNSFQISFM